MIIVIIIMPGAEVGRGTHGDADADWLRFSISGYGAAIPAAAYPAFYHSGSSSARTS